MDVDIITRQLNNIGMPFINPKGVPLVGVTLRFTLVDEHYRATSAFDIETRHSIAGDNFVQTDANGEFSVDLWPNTRGDKKTFYLVQGDSPQIERFASVVPDGIDPISFFDFKYLYKDVPVEEYTLITDIISDILKKKGIE